MSTTRKLTDLNPQFVNHGGSGVTYSVTGGPVPLTEGVGLDFDCPCGCDQEVYVRFTNPIGPGPGMAADGHPTWERTGDTFETLTLTPSILRVGACAWHGFITNGQVLTV